MRRAGILVTVAAAAIACASQSPEDGGREAERLYVPFEVPRILAREPKPSRVIYLNREGATLHAGPDEASLNRSGILLSAGLESFSVPAFQGAPRQWDRIASCLREHFAQYDVEVVERRPLEPGYVMAVVGGEPGPLVESTPRTHGIVAGLAPFNGQPVENAVVLVFARQHREDPRGTCETAAMEIAHAYGLDHSMHCGDLMSYLRPCGRRRFQDHAVPCGEREGRPCADGRPSQSSHRRLLEILGPARGAR